MSFPKAAASCADTAVIVRYATFLLVAIIPFAGKEIHHPSSGNGFNQVWQQVAQGGRGWHRHNPPIAQSVLPLISLFNKEATAKIRA